MGLRDLVCVWSNLVLGEIKELNGVADADEAATTIRSHTFFSSRSSRLVFVAVFHVWQPVVL